MSFLRSIVADSRSLTSATGSATKIASSSPAQFGSAGPERKEDSYRLDGSTTQTASENSLTSPASDANASSDIAVIESPAPSHLGSNYAALNLDSEAHRQSEISQSSNQDIERRASAPAVHDLPQSTATTQLAQNPSNTLASQSQAASAANPEPISPAVPALIVDESELEVSVASTTRTAVNTNSGEGNNPASAALAAGRDAGVSDAGASAVLKVSPAGSEIAGTTATHWNAAAWQAGARIDSVNDRVHADPSLPDWDAQPAQTTSNIAAENHAEQASRGEKKTPLASTFLNEPAEMKRLSGQNKLPQRQESDAIVSAGRADKSTTNNSIASGVSISSNPNRKSDSVSPAVKATQSTTDPLSASVPISSSSQSVAATGGHKSETGNDHRITHQPKPSNEPVPSYPRSSLRETSPSEGTFIQHRNSQKQPETPIIQIGQIDIFIEAAQQPAAKSPTTQAVSDLASRNYLRRL